MPQRGRGRAVSHATSVSAYSQLETLSDARALAADPTLNLSFDSLVCILSQKTVERTKSTMGRHRERAPTYLAAYFGGTSLVELAAEHRIPPSMLVRVILEHLGLRKGKEVKCTVTLRTHSDHMPRPTCVSYVAPKHVSNTCHHIAITLPSHCHHIAITSRHIAPHQSTKRKPRTTYTSHHIHHTTSHLFCCFFLSHHVSSHTNSSLSLSHVC